jgi:argininosuccinate lyase
LIRIATGVISTLKINRKKMEEALSVDLLATDLAYYLVRKSVPFRLAHSISGLCVSAAEKNQCTLRDLTLEQLKVIRFSFFFIVKQELFFFNQL